jgi:hypothetical protein
MDSLSFSMISLCICSSINIGHPSCLSLTFRVCASSVVFSASFGALCYVKFICCQSLCKSVVLILLHLLHCFQPLLKVFWSSLQTSFLDELFLLTVILLPSEFPTVVPSFPLCQNFSSQFPTAPSLPLMFSTTLSFPTASNLFVALYCRVAFSHCTKILRHTLLSHQVFSLCQNSPSRFTSMP